MGLGDLIMLGLTMFTAGLGLAIASVFVACFSEAIAYHIKTAGGLIGVLGVVIALLGMISDGIRMLT